MQKNSTAELTTVVVVAEMRHVTNVGYNAEIPQAGILLWGEGAVCTRATNFLKNLDLSSELQLLQTS